MHLYTNQEEQFILDNYPIYGATYCAKHLNKSYGSIIVKAKRMGIKNTSKIKHPSLQNINPELFWNITSPEIAYFLGFFWADGYIRNYISKKGINNYKISLEIVSDDYKDLKFIFDKLGKWAIHFRKRKDSWKETATISTNSKDIYNFLHSHDFTEKSLQEPTKILEKIPKHLHLYFWRGFFDGDGCISLYGENSQRATIKFSGQKNYKWKELTTYINSIGVEIFSIYSTTDKKNHGSSGFVIQNKKDVNILISYLLKSELGLARKTEKMKIFQNNIIL